MIPIRDVLPTRITPYVTRVLVGINAAVFLLALPQLEQVVRDLGAVPYHFTGLEPDRIPSELMRPGDDELARPVPDDGTAWLRTLTHMFLHGGWFHLLSNMWFLWIFGDNVEERLGRGRFVVLYLVAGLASLATQIVASPASGLTMVGASGAISGVLGAYLVFFPRAEIITLVPIGFLPLLFSVPAKLFLIYWIGLQVVSGLIAPGAVGVAWWAHVGGFVAGFALARPLAPPSPPYRRRRRDIEVGRPR